MTRHVPTIAIVCSALVVAGLAATPRASAQEEGEVRILEVVRVVAPRLVRHSEQTTTGARVETVSLTRRVSARDLDLGRTADVMELERRINATAEEACEYLAELFPLQAEDSPDCVRRAVDDAMAQVDDALAEMSD